MKDYSEGSLFGGLAEPGVTPEKRPVKQKYRKIYTVCNSDSRKQHKLV